MRKRRTAKKVVANKKRWNFEDNQKIKVIGENTHREGSRFGKGFALLAKSATVGLFRKKTDDAQVVLREAVKEKFVRVA